MELLLTLLLLELTLLPFSSPAFTPQTSYFLACGSSAPVSLAGDSPSRTFQPDAPYLLDLSTSTTVTNAASGGGVYAAARRFTSPATYSFTIKSSDTHVIRLHFVPTSRLSNASFSVAVHDRFLLLSNFSPTSSPSPSPLIKEYLLHADAGALDLVFTPSPLAFVNAIELFTAPAILLSASTAQNVGGSRPITSVSGQALETIYRINVGGPAVTPANDTLWRTWAPDDKYLTTKTTSFVNSTSKMIVYEEYKGRSKEIAPQIVYSTARTMAVTPDLVFGSNQGFHFNVSWSFSVPPGYLYFVRLHFCDIISKTVTDLYFDVYLGDDMATKDLHPDGYTDGMLASPFYLDYTADPSGSGFVNVSVGRATKDIPASSVNAILNGLEIMKVNNSGSSLAGGSYGISAQPNKKSSHLAIIVSSIIGGLILIAALCVTLIVVCKPRRRANPSSPKQSWYPFAANGTNSSTVSGVSGGTTQQGTSPIANLGLSIPFLEIKYATKDFADDLVIGHGGFGKVYKGVRSDGTTVAVKRATRGSRQGYPEFQTEIMVLSSIRHRHLVSLIGYCDEQSEMILVYEYMENGPLKNYLHGSGSAELPCLSWKQRLEICIGAARGLHYLHTGYSDNIIHRDIKSTNILLGENYLSKVSDFGLSRQGPSRGETHVSTVVKGTFGYLDPEYFKIQKLTDKSDVYSFGVLLFEVLCARPATDQTVPREQISLAEWALHCQKRGTLDRIADPRLAGKINLNSMRTFGKTAAQCLAESGVDRPTMADVLWNLEYALQLQMTEVRREPHEDSGKVESGIQMAAMRGAPSGRVVGEEEMSKSELSTNNVFSQLINDEGR